MNKQQFQQLLDSSIQNTQVLKQQFKQMLEMTNKADKDKQQYQKQQIDFIKRTIKDNKSTNEHRFNALLLLQQTSECQDYDYMLYLKTKILNRLKKLAENKLTSQQVQFMADNNVSELKGMFQFQQKIEAKDVNENNTLYAHYFYLLNLECLFTWGNKYQNMKKLTTFYSF